MKKIQFHYDKEIFRQNLKKYRKVAGYSSAKAFADALSKDGGIEVPENTYKSYEGGKREPPLSTLIRIVNKLGIHVDDLFSSTFVPIDEYKQIEEKLQEMYSDGGSVSEIRYESADVRRARRAKMRTGEDLYKKILHLTDAEYEKKAIDDEKYSYFYIRNRQKGFGGSLSIYEYKELEKKVDRERKKIITEYLNKKAENRKKTTNKDDTILFDTMAQSIDFPYGYDLLGVSSCMEKNQLLYSQIEILFVYYLYHINLMGIGEGIIHRFIEGAKYSKREIKSLKDRINLSLLDHFDYVVTNDVEWVDKLIARRCMVSYDKLKKKSEELELTIPYLLKYIFLQELRLRMSPDLYERFQRGEVRKDWIIGDNISIGCDELWYREK